MIFGEREIAPHPPGPFSHSISFSAFTLMRVMEEVGYIDVDLSWKRDEYFVCGGKKPNSSRTRGEESHDF